MNKYVSEMLFLTIILFSIDLHADQVASSGGISISIPDNWVLMTKDQTQSIANDIKERYPQLGNIDYSKIEIYAMDTTGSDFYENLNIGITAEIPPISNEIIQKIADMMMRQNSNFGLNPILISATKESFGSNDAIAIHYEINMPTGTERFQQFMVFMPGDIATYIITFSFSASNGLASIAGVRKMLNTVQVTRSSALSWSRLPKRVQNIISYSITGALIGLAIGLMKYLGNRRKKQLEH
jgi:hypothetical protein